MSTCEVVIAIHFISETQLNHVIFQFFKVFNMDGRRFIDAVFANQTARPITQVVMNLPNDAAEYLGTLPAR